jgi:hypothetical protein
MILVAESTESRLYWLSLLQQMTGSQTNDISREWLQKLVNIDWMSSSGTEAGARASNFSIDEAFSVLQKAKRNADRNYVAEIFKMLYKTGGGGGNGDGGNGKSRSSASDHKLNLEEFVALFKYTAITANVQQIFNRMLDVRSARSSVSAKTFFQFILNQQKERASMDDVLDWIIRNEPVLSFGNLSVAGFANYIMDDENSIFNRSHRVVYQDMTQPLCHYFIATSHNTYLTKDQLKSKSSVDAYINALKRGCKCVELDCWDGPNNEPIIYHGHTLTSKILFRDVIQGIRDYAFCVSKYPVILSFENHCSVEQQKVMAMHLQNILGDMLHTQPPNPDTETCLPSPEDLSGYVLVKAKKRRAGELDGDDFDDDFDDDFSDDDITEEEVAAMSKRTQSMDGDMADTISMSSMSIEEDDLSSTTSSLKGTSSKDKRSSTLKNLMQSVELFRKSTDDKPKVPKIAQELSDLVTYCQATRFKSFEHSRLNCKHYEMSSFGEKKALKFARDDPKTLLHYNQRQLSRIYPAGARIDSSNYDPMTLWLVGCQLVALNYQTACREMQMNQGLFQDNGGCGYVLKPEFMRQEKIDFDPHGPFKDVHTLTIRELHGHQIPYKADKVIKSERSLLVQVKVVGVEADNHVLRTRPVKNNGYNPTWDDELVFKIHVPDLALVNFTVYTKDAFVAQFTLPFSSIMQGYRKIPLQTKHSEPVPNAHLLAHISIQAPI